MIYTMVRMSIQGTAVAPIVPGSGLTAGVTDAGWETMSAPPNFTHVSGFGVAAGTPDPDRGTMPIPPDCKRVSGNGGDAGDPFFVRFALTMVFWPRCVSFKTGTSCDVP